MKRAANGKYICQYNHECECDIPECHKCGWNPEVANSRLKTYRENLGMPAKKYTIPFTGYCEVWANDSEDAIDRADRGELYFVHYDFGEAKCPEEEEENDS